MLFKLTSPKSIRRITLYKQFMFCSLLALLYVGCSLEVGESPAEPVLLKTSGLTCVQNVSQSTLSYFSSKMSEVEIRTYFDCLHKSVKNFEKYTSGSEQGSYSKEEVKKTAEMVLFDGQEISQKLIDSAMEIKILVAGGSNKKVSRAEIKSILLFLNLLKLAFVDLRDDIELLSLRSQHSKMSFVEIEKVFKKIRKGLNPLVFHFEKFNTSFDISQLSVFVNELNKNTVSEPNVKKQVTNFVDLLVAFRNIVIQSKTYTRQIHSKEWASLFEELFTWYEQWLKYNYLIRDEKILYGETLSEFIEMTDEILDSLKRAVDRQWVKKITYGKIEKFIDGLESLDKLPGPLRSDSLKSIIRPVFDKIFGDLSVQFSDRESHGLGRRVLAEIESEFYNWAEIQRYIDKQFDGRGRQGAYSFPEQRFFLQNENDFKGFFVDWPNGNSNFDEIKDAILNLKPLYRANDPKVVLANESYRRANKITNNFYQMSVLNIIRAGVSLIIRGYADDHDRAVKSTGLSESEVVRFIEDIMLVGQDLNIISPGSENPGKEIFLEANIFTYSGDGMKFEGLHNSNKLDAIKLSNSSLLLFEEGIELISYLYSSIKGASGVYADLTNTCLAGPKDVFGRPTFYVHCYWKNFISGLSSQVVNMPQMHSYFGQYEKVNSANREEWLELQGILKKLTPETDGQWMGFSQIGKTVMILHFLETLLTRFDKNEDGVVDEKESELALPLFDGILHKLGKAKCMDLSTEDRELVFKFILENAAVPGSGIDVFLDNPFGWFGWKIQVGRRQGLKIMETLLNAVSEQGRSAEQCEASDKEVEEFKSDIQKIKSFRVEKKI